MFKLRKSTGSKEFIMEFEFYFPTYKPYPLTNYQQMHGLYQWLHSQ